MGKTKLFDNWTWKRHLPDPFKNVTAKRTDAYSKYNTTTTKESTLHASTLSSILAFMDIDENNPQAKGAIGTKGNLIISEYPSRRVETHVCVYDKDTGKFIAGVFKNVSSTNSEAYEMKANGHSGSALFFTLIPVAMEDAEFFSAYNQLLSCKKAGYTDIESAAKWAAVMCDNLYRRIENAVNFPEAGINVDISATGNILPLNPLALNRNDYSPEKVIRGRFEILALAPPKPIPDEPVDNTDFAGKYAFSEREFTDEEKLMIPEIENWYIIPPEVVQICRHAKMTTGSTVQMRNFMLRGAGGVGKTEGVKAIAAGLKLPYTYITCSSNTEIGDLLGLILPYLQNDSSDKTETLKPHRIYPTFEDIRMDPATAYCVLTGIYNKNITEDEAYIKLVETVYNDAVKDNGGQRYKYFNTTLVNAIRYGWVCEIQEPSIIANPGVLVGLNALLDNCKTVTLPTGEIIRRHPDTVLILTTNTDYNGCKPMNQSVISRMNLVFDLEELDLDTLVGRVIKVTQCEDIDAVRQMAEIVKAISEKCREQHIKDGCCGTRELISWVQSYMICGNMLETSRYTVLSSVSSDPENRSEIYGTCLETKCKAA